MLVSESAGDRLARLNRKGRFVSYIGKKGRGVGEMVGPQFMTQDSRQNIYVSDYGNSRVDVFDKDGNGLFYFGGYGGDIWTIRNFVSTLKTRSKAFCI